jgi:hypothetical protein
MIPEKRYFWSPNFSKCEVWSSFLFLFSITWISSAFLFCYVLYINSDLSLSVSRRYTRLYKIPLKLFICKMLTSNWVLLITVHSLDKVTALAKTHGVSRNRINNLKNSTKYSFKCREYRKYPICNYELTAIVFIIGMAISLLFHHLMLKYHLQIG